MPTLSSVFLPAPPSALLWLSSLCRLAAMCIYLQLGVALVRAVQQGRVDGDNCRYRSFSFSSFDSSAPAHTQNFVLFNAVHRRCACCRLQGSYHDTANQLCSMGSDMEHLQAELEQTRRSIAVMEARQAESARMLRVMETKAIDEGIRLNSVILERDSALSSLRQLQGGGGERPDSVEALAKMTVELQRRDSFIAMKLEKDLQELALNEATRELAESRSKLSTARKTMADGEQLEQTVFDWNKQLVEKLSLKNTELQKALSTVELMVAENCQLQDQMSRTAERSCDAIEKVNDAEHRLTISSRLHELELSRLKVESQLRYSALQEECFNVQAELAELWASVAANDTEEEDKNGAQQARSSARCTAALDRLLAPSVLASHLPGASMGAIPPPLGLLLRSRPGRLREL